MNTIYQLEQFFQSIGDRPQHKLEETITTFDRDILYYNVDAIKRQATKAVTLARVTYEDHRKVIEVAVNMLRKETPHAIAMCILTHRFFDSYRTNTFRGEGSFYLDYNFLIQRVSALFSKSTHTLIPAHINRKLAEFTEPALLQINHIVGTVQPVKVPPTSDTLNEWAIKLNMGAPESTTYRYHTLSLKS